MKILLTGNTGYLTENFIKSAFPDSQVTVLGNAQIRSDKKKNIRSVRLTSKEEDDTGEELMQLFAAYEFDCVVYFSNYLTFHGTLAGELEQLRWVLKCCAQQEEIRVVYLTGPEESYSTVTGKTVLAEAPENLCRFYQENRGLSIKILRLLYLYSPTYQEDYIYHLLQNVNESTKITFQEHPEQRTYFLSMDDLAELLYRLLDSWSGASVKGEMAANNLESILLVPDCFGITFSRLGEELQKLRPGLEVIFTEEAVVQILPYNDKVLRYSYGWFPKISILAELPGLYGTYRESKTPEPGKMERLTAWLKSGGSLWRFAELFVGFFLVELLLKLAGNQVQFRMIDFRLLFVVLTSTVYGMNIGIAAAALESAALIGSYSTQGTSWFTLFYEPMNWVPFIAYFMVGAVCGYVRMKSRDDITFAERENNLIQEKFFFVRRLYLETLRDKREYKRQIIGSRDSFGKIFHITRQLDVVRPQEIFIRTIQVMEEVLENRTISIYSLGQNKNFARLEAASGGIMESEPRSIRMDDYREAIETLESGEAWTNAGLMEGYPMYAAGVRKNGGLVLVIFVRDAEYSQMSLYYLNLLKILCGLVETALLRALDYQEASRDEQYLKGTNIMKEHYFLERLSLYHSMREQKLADYTLLRLERGDMPLEAAEDILGTKIRENDVIGITAGGTLYVILTQTAERYVPIVTGRLEEAGFQCRICASGAVEPE